MIREDATEPSRADLPLVVKIELALPNGERFTNWMASLNLLPFKRGLEAIIRGVDVPNYSGPLRRAVEKRVSSRLRAGRLLSDAADKKAEGYYLLEGQAMGVHGGSRALRLFVGGSFCNK